MADLEQVANFFQHLYDSGDDFELVAVKDGKARRNSFEFGGSMEVVYSAIQSFEAKGWNVYASVLPLQKQAQKMYDRVWIDRDDKEAAWPFGADPEWDYPAWPEPTTLVFTSEGRWQAIWKLNEDVPESEGRSLIKRLAAVGSGDGAVHDPRRVLRVPGVVNAKRNEVARLHSTSSTSIDPGTFMLPDDIASGGLTVEALMNTTVSAPHQVLGEWLSGADEGDRARKAFVTARFLKSCLVTYDDALAIVNTGAKRANPPLSDSEVVHSVRSAYNRAD